MRFLAVRLRAILGNFDFMYGMNSAIKLHRAGLLRKTNTTCQIVSLLPSLPIWVAQLWFLFSCLTPTIALGADTGMFGASFLLYGLFVIISMVSPLILIGILIIIAIIYLAKAINVTQHRAAETIQPASANASPRKPLYRTAELNAYTKYRRVAMLLFLLSFLLVTSFFVVPKVIENRFHAACKNELKTNVYAKRLRATRGINVTTESRAQYTGLDIHADALTDDRIGFSIAQSQHGKIYTKANSMPGVAPESKIEIRQTISRQRRGAFYNLVQNHLQVIDIETDELLADTTSYHLNVGGENQGILDNATVLWHPHRLDCGYRVPEAFRRYPSATEGGSRTGYQALHLALLVAKPL